MSYRQRTPPIYSQRRPTGVPQLRRELLTFRSEWLQGYDRAMGEIVKLSKAGWKTDLAKTALMESQAKKMIANLEKAGFETRFIPAADWLGEKIGFLVYKPKPGAEAPVNVAELAKAGAKPKHEPKPKTVTLPPTEELE